MNKARTAVLLRRSGLALVALLLVVQLVPAGRSNPPEGAEISAPPEIQAILERSCYDCHSNRTEWPWYAYVAPISWWVVHHVDDGRGDLNMTEWPLMDFEEQLHYLDEMKEEVEEGEMPLPSYLWVHRDARLSDEERTALFEWIDGEVASLSGP